MSNLIELQRDYILGILEDVRTANGLKFLVIDDDMEQIFEYLVTSPQELLKYVAGVDKIDSRTRKGQSAVECIYMLRPTKYNINCMETDFGVRPPRYKKCHIRFLPGFFGPVETYFKKKRYIPQYIASFQNCNISLLPKEQQFFQTLEIDKPVQLFFNPNCTDLVDLMIKRTADALLNLCVITGEYPIVRYSCLPNAQGDLTRASVITKKVAFAFQEALDSYARNNESFPPPSTRPRSVCIITDRTLDLFAPFLHDFNYQAMAYDLIPDLDTVTDEYHYSAENELGEQEKKTAKLRDYLDPDWVEMKHQHILDASEYLTGKINELISKNPLLVDRTNVKNTTDLLSVVAHLKSFDEERRRMILHRTLIDQCLSLNQERRLAEWGEIEQNVAAFGIDLNGDKCKHLTETLLPALCSKEATVTDKVRYIIVYALYRGGLIKDDLIKLLSFIGVDSSHEFFGHFMNLFMNFELLDFPLIKEDLKRKPSKKEWFHDSITKDPNIYNTSRFIPASGSVLSKIIANPLLLSEDYFPYVKDKPIELLDDEEMEQAGAAAAMYNSTSLKNPRHRAAWTKNSSNVTKNPRQRFIYYSIGGITFPELRAAYDQSNMKNRDVFIGSDGITTPLSFMKSVEYLTVPRDKLNLKVDQKLKETAPEYLSDDMAPVSKPVSHVHVKSTDANLESPSPVKQPSPSENDVKIKKKGKFRRLLRSKDKDKD